MSKLQYTDADLEFLHLQTINEVKKMENDVDYTSRFPFQQPKEEHNEVLH